MKQGGSADNSSNEHSLSAFLLIVRMCSSRMRRTARRESSKRSSPVPHFFSVNTIRKQVCSVSTARESWDLFEQIRAPPSQVEEDRIFYKGRTPP